MDVLHSGSGKRWVLPENLRDELKVIVGEIVEDSDILGRLDTSHLIITVGDIVTLTLLEMGIVPDLSIVDFQTQRKGDDDLKGRFAPFEQTEITVASPPAEITHELWDAIADGISNPRKLRIVVEGEEDLAAIPCILLSPVGTSVIYGIPFKGLMLLRVDEQIQALAKEILNKMEI